MFFESIMAIYGTYGRIIDQMAVEDKFNDWASRKLFLIADEVVAQSGRYHVKNILKAFITGEWIRINPKNIAAYDERNHVNIVFLSNEAVPVVLEEDDRRHTVIWTPDKLPAQFYHDVSAEIAGGGSAALHDYLLHYDLGDFHSATAPIATKAKAVLIDQSLDNTTRFIDALMDGEIGNFRFEPALTQELYNLYRLWVQRIGEKAGPLRRLENVLARKRNIHKEKKRFLENGIARKNPQWFFMCTLKPSDGNTEQAWLGECVDRFRDAFKEYRGMQCD
jgi:putative DNA primase/helicase